MLWLMGLVGFICGWWDCNVVFFSSLIFIFFFFFFFCFVCVCEFFSSLLFFIEKHNKSI